MQKWNIMQLRGKRMITSNPGDYEKMFPWRKYLIDPSKDETLDNLKENTPKEVVDALKAYLKKYGDIRIR